MPLKTIDAVETRKERLIILPNQSFIGQQIRQYVYVVGDKKIRINSDVILEIVEKYTTDQNGNDVHKIKMNGNGEIFVDDSGLAKILA